LPWAGHPDSAQPGRLGHRSAPRGRGWSPRPRGLVPPYGRPHDRSDQSGPGPHDPACGPAGGDDGGGGGDRDGHGSRRGQRRRTGRHPGSRRDRRPGPGPSYPSSDACSNAPPHAPGLILGPRPVAPRRSGRTNPRSADRSAGPRHTKGEAMPIEQGCWVTLQQVLGSAKTLLDADRAGLLLLDQAGALHWASGSDRLVEAGVGDLSVPVQLGGGPVGTLDLYDPGPREWDDGDAAALRAYAGLVASVLAAAVAAGVTGRLGDPLQEALEPRSVL